MTDMIVFKSKKVSKFYRSHPYRSATRVTSRVASHVTSRVASLVASHVTPNVRWNVTSLSLALELVCGEVVRRPILDPRKVLRHPHLETFKVCAVRLASLLKLLEEIVVLSQLVHDLRNVDCLLRPLVLQEVVFKDEYLFGNSRHGALHLQFGQPVLLRLLLLHLNVESFVPDELVRVVGVDNESLHLPRRHLCGIQHFVANSKGPRVRTFALGRPPALEKGAVNDMLHV
jgi:hypothetical protein